MLPRSGQDTALCTIYNQHLAQREHMQRLHCWCTCKQWSAHSAGVEDVRLRERAELIARDLIEYINSIDYQKYFDAMGRPGSRGGNQEKQFSDFSIRAVDAAQVPSLPSGCHILILPLSIKGFMLQSCAVCKCDVAQAASSGSFVYSRARCVNCTPSRKGALAASGLSAEAAGTATMKHSYGVKSMLVWRAGKAQGVPGIHAQGCSCSSEGTGQRARRSLVTDAVATSDAGMPHRGHTFIRAMGSSRDLITASMGSGPALGNAQAVTSCDLLVRACIWHVT